MLEEKSNKLTTKYYRLERLCQWEHIDKVNDMLRAGVSAGKVAMWCRENGFTISNPKMYEYKDMLLGSLARDINVETMLGIGVVRKPIIIKNEAYKETVRKAKSDLEILEEIIQKGFRSIADNPNIGYKDAMKAIELRNRLTKGGLNNLTIEGLEQLRELENAKFEAVLEIIKQYVPEDKWPELEEAIEEAERNYYEENAPHLLKIYDESDKDE